MARLGLRCCLGLSSAAACVLLFIVARRGALSREELLRLSSAANDTEPLVIGVATAVSAREERFLHMCRRARLRCTLLGLGQRWRGFGWLKDFVYKPALAHLPDNALVVLTDVSDTLIQAGCSHDELLRRYQAVSERAPAGGVERVVVSLETACSTGACPAIAVGRDAGIKELHHVNGGFQAGRAQSLLRMWRAVRTRAGRNQASLGMYAKAHPNAVVADTRQRLAATIVLDKGEWERDWMVAGRLIRNRHTGVAPCFLHFPGTQERHRRGRIRQNETSKGFMHSRMRRWDAIVRLVDDGVV